MRRLLVATFTVLVATTFVACGGGSAPNRSTPQQTAHETPAPSPTHTTATGRTGIAAVDSVLDAIEGGDVETLVSLMRFTKLACVATPNVMEGEAPCDGESPGTLVETIPIATCEGGNIVRHSAEARLRQLFNERPQTALYGLYRTTGSSFIAQGFFGRGDPLYAVVLVSDVNGMNWGWALLMNDEGIVDMAEGCAQTPADFVTSWELTVPPLIRPLEATPDASANARRTGMQDLDAVIDAVFSRDVEQMRPLLGFQSVACIAPTPTGIGGPPYCLEDEVPGTIVQVLPVAGCEGSWLSSKLLNGLRPLVEGVGGVYAVYRDGDDIKIVFSRKVVPADPSPTAGLLITTHDGKVASISAICDGSSAPQLVEQVAPADFILPPP